MENWSKVTNIWEGLENFRQLRRDIFRIGPKQIDQKTLDSLFAGYNFQIGLSSKSNLLGVLEKTLESGEVTDPVLRNDIEEQIGQLQQYNDELFLKRSMDHFDYDFVFKEEGNHLSGIVKITHRTNPKHLGLIDFSDSNDPIIYLAELEDGTVRLHINYGEELAIVEQPTDLTWKWTHCLEEGYHNIAHSEVGVITMSKITKEIKLEDGNLAAVEARKKASQVQENDKTMFENSVNLLSVYKEPLSKLSP